MGLLGGDQRHLLYQEISTDGYDAANCPGVCHLPALPVKGGCQSNVVEKYENTLCAVAQNHCNGARTVRIRLAATPGP